MRSFPIFVVILTGSIVLAAKVPAFNSPPRKTAAPTLILKDTPPVNTNLTAFVSVVGVTSNSIQLDLSYSSTDGSAPTMYHVYRDGVWIADVPATLPPPPDSPTNVSIMIAP